MKDYAYIFDLRGKEATNWIRRHRRPLVVEVSQLVDQGSDNEAWLSIDFSLSGKPWNAVWAPKRLLTAVAPPQPRRRPVSEAVKELCVWDGDILNPLPSGWLLTTRVDAYSIAGGEIPQFTLSFAAGPTSTCVRSVGTAQIARNEMGAISSGSFLLLWFLPVLALLGSAIIFLLLAIRSRLSISTGFIIGVVSLLVSFFTTSARTTNLVQIISAYGAAAFFVILLFFVWSSGESLMRRSESRLFRGLDSLRQGRLNHSLARQFLMGFASGAVLGGVKLLLSTIAVTAPGVHPESLSVSLQNWTVDRTFFIDGILPLAFVVLAKGISGSIPAIRSPLVTVILAALLVSLVAPWMPSYFYFVSAVTVAYVLVQTMSSQGILAALVASIVSVLLPLAVFAIQSPRWLPGSLWGSLAVLLMIVTIGVVSWFHKAERSEEPLTVFISYSRKDRDLLQQLCKFLVPLESEGLITVLYDAQIDPGKNWSEMVKRYLAKSDIVLLLVSTDFLISPACQDEQKIALLREGKGVASVIPVILRASSWETTPLGRLEALPTDGKPLTTWTDQDMAFLDIAKGVRRVAENRRERTRESQHIEDADRLRPLASA